MSDATQNSPEVSETPDSPVVVVEEVPGTSRTHHDFFAEHGVAAGTIPEATSHILERAARARAKENRR